MPNLHYFRPCDAEELRGVWSIALSTTKTPSIISLARDPVTIVPHTDHNKVHLGAYEVVGEPRAEVTFVSCGTNLHYAYKAAQSLKSKHGITCRLVSAPCLRLFDQQSAEYQQSVIPWDGTPVVSVEEYVPTIWVKYATASVGMKGFGYSASNERIM